MTLGLTARETRELIAKWETTAAMMRTAAAQDELRGNHEQGCHALGIADGLGVAVWSLRLMAGETEIEVRVPRLESV